MRVLLGPELFPRFEAGGHALCNQLARAARDLERASAQLQEALTDVVASMLPGGGRAALARAVATKLVEHVTAEPVHRISAVVRAMRVCGVLLCVAEGRDLRTCPCLLALGGEAADEVRGDVREALQHGLDAFTA